MSRRVVIIGAGAVGLYLASELIKRGVSVVLVESGGTDLGGFSTDSFRSIGRRHQGIHLGRSRTIGGTTNLWGGQLVEFQPIDFAGRDWLPASRWPVSYEQILPWYRATYEALGISPEAQSDDAVWKKVGLTPPNLDGGLEVFLTRWLRIPNFALQFADLLEHSRKLTLLAEHTAVGFQGAGCGRISAVRVMNRTGEIKMIEGDVFILAAGTIEISRLLLHAARSSDWACPWRDNVHVGAWFKDHLGGRIATVKPTSSKTFLNAFATVVVAGQKYQPKCRLRNDVLIQEQILNIQGMFAFDSSISENLVYLKQFAKAALYSRKIGGIGDLVRNAVKCSRYMLPLMWRYMHDHRIFVPAGSKISLLMQSEQAPNFDSRITIDPAVIDKWGLPRVVLDWKLSGTELPSAREFALRAKKALLAAGLGELDIDPALSALEPSFLDILEDTYHQAGGAVMAANEEDGVVDANLRVFGTENLYVAGAATFRTVGNANTTFTALAFATRLADFLVHGAATAAMPCV